MKTSIVSLFICLLLASKGSGQSVDSIRLEVIKARSNEDRTYYKLKDGEGNKYYTVCSCLERHKKGEFVMIARKDFDIISEKVNY